MFGTNMLLRLSPLPRAFLTGNGVPNCGISAEESVVAHTGYDYNYDEYPENHIKVKIAAAVVSTAFIHF